MYISNKKKHPYINDLGIQMLHEFESKVAHVELWELYAALLL